MLNIPPKPNFRSTAEALFPNYLYPLPNNHRMASARVHAKNKKIVRNTPKKNSTIKRKRKSLLKFNKCEMYLR